MSGRFHTQYVWVLCNLLERYALMPEYAEFSPPFHFDFIDNCLWQMELCTVINRPQTMMACTSSTAHLELRLRLINMMTLLMEGQEECTVKINIIFENGARNYLMFWDLNVFRCPANTSWHSQPIEIVPLFQKLKNSNLEIKIGLELIKWNIYEFQSDEMEGDVYRSLRNMVMGNQNPTNMILISNDGFMVPVHSAILFSRCPQLQNIIDMNQIYNGNNKIYVTLDTILLFEFVNFVYTGALTKKCFSVHRVFELMKFSVYLKFGSLQNVCENILIQKLEFPFLVPLVEFADANNLYPMKKRLFCAIHINWTSFFRGGFLNDIKSLRLIREVVDYVQLN